MTLSSSSWLHSPRSSSFSDALWAAVNVFVLDVFLVAICLVYRIISWKNIRTQNYMPIFVNTITYGIGYMEKFFIGDAPGRRPSRPPAAGRGHCLLHDSQFMCDIQWPLLSLPSRFNSPNSRRALVALLAVFSVTDNF